MGSYFFDWSVVWRARYDLLTATLTAIEIAVASIVLGFLLGVFLAFGRNSKRRWISISVLVYIEAMRNSPSLVKMYFIFYGFPSLGVLPSPMLSGILALVLHNSAYMAEIFRGGLNTVASGQIEAARSLGLRPLSISGLIVLPQAFRAALPKPMPSSWPLITGSSSTYLSQ